MMKWQEKKGVSGCLVLRTNRVLSLQDGACAFWESLLSISGWMVLSTSRLPQDE
jgi:hypothetical protein